MARDHGAQIKDDALYEELRKQGQSRKKPHASPMPRRTAAWTTDPPAWRIEPRSI